MADGRRVIRSPPVDDKNRIWVGEDAVASNWNVPGHVAPALVVDFDIYRPPALQQGLQEAWQTLADALDRPVPR